METRWKGVTMAYNYETLNAEPELRKNGEAARPRVDEDRCLGCGLCMKFCPTDAMTMIPGLNRNMPPKNMNDLCVKLLKQKGRLSKH